MTEILPPRHSPPSPDLATHLLNIVERLTIIEQMSATVLNEQDEAKVSRRGLHQKVEEIKNELTSVKGDVKNLQEKVSDMTPTLKLHERLINQIKGGGIVIGVIWSVALILLGFALKSLWVWLGSRP